MATEEGKEGGASSYLGKSFQVQLNNSHQPFQFNIFIWFFPLLISRSCFLWSANLVCILTFLNLLIFVHFLTNCLIHLFVFSGTPGFPGQKISNEEIQEDNTTNKLNHSFFVFTGVYTRVDKYINWILDHMKK